ncbi:hypothetical protein NDU88_007005 [Pleurodeles waltl]|uniref:Uncharacterized protein n=1 Tax=Pleurodeles waltl TaxID=8319 RepID=A0AAV7TZX9_PLEWA|nr:hypothetical protein NDU88_007005 [Pleurodeles waltl]
MRVVTAPAVPAACSAGSLPLRARRPRSSEDATPHLLPGLIGLGRVASSCLASRSYGVHRHDSMSPLL